MNATKTYTLDDLKALAEEIANAPYDERGLTIDGKSYKTDVGYAFDGINMFLDILERRENDSN